MFIFLIWLKPYIWFKPFGFNLHHCVYGVAHPIPKPTV